MGQGTFGSPSHTTRSSSKWWSQWFTPLATLLAIIRWLLIIFAAFACVSGLLEGGYLAASLFALGALGLKFTNEPWKVTPGNIRFSLAIYGVSLFLIAGGFGGFAVNHPTYLAREAAASRAEAVRVATADAAQAAASAARETPAPPVVATPARSIQEQSDELLAQERDAVARDSLDESIGADRVRRIELRSGMPAKFATGDQDADMAAWLDDTSDE